MRTFLFLLLSCNLIFSQNIIINEVLTSSTSFIDEDNEASDWIELFNQSNNLINLEGFYLSDDENNLTKWQFPNLSLNPNSYLLIYCSGKDKKSNEIHTNFKISSNGEVIFLSNKSGELISRLDVPKLINDISYGKSILNENYVYYTNPTPKLKNSNDEFLGIVDSKITFSNNGGSTKFGKS